MLAARAPDGQRQRLDPLIGRAAACLPVEVVAEISLGRHVHVGRSLPEDADVIALHRNGRFQELRSRERRAIGRGDVEAALAEVRRDRREVERIQVGEIHLLRERRHRDVEQVARRHVHVEPAEGLHLAETRELVTRKARHRRAEVPIEHVLEEEYFVLDDCAAGG